MATHRALIKTHHITSRKKVTVLKKAADRFGCWVLLRSGGCPGVMFVEGAEGGVRGWVGIVSELRYKDYQLVARPAPITAESDATGATYIVVEKSREAGRVEEVGTVKEFGKRMEEKGMLGWWRVAMGYRKE